MVFSPPQEPTRRLCGYDAVVLVVHPENPKLRMNQFYVAHFQDHLRLPSLSPITVPFDEKLDVTMFVFSSLFDGFYAPFFGCTFGLHSFPLQHIIKLQKEAVKATETIEKLHGRLKENSSKKSKVHGGDAKTIEVWAEEKAKEMFQTWQTDRYKEQIRVLKESRALLTQQNEKLEKDLAAEKTKCAGHEKDIDNNDRLHKLEVKNLNQQLDTAHKDKEQLQMAFFPRMSSTGPAVTSRRGENASMGNQYTPEYPPGQKLRNPPGSADTP